MGIAPKLPEVKGRDGLANGHELVHALVAEVFEKDDVKWTLATLESGPAIAKADGATRLAVVCAAVELQSWLSDQTRKPDKRSVKSGESVDDALRTALAKLIEALCKRAMPNDSAALARLAETVAPHVDPQPRERKDAWEAWAFPAPGVIGLIVDMAQSI